MDVSHEDKADYLRWAGVRYVYAPLHFGDLLLPASNFLQDAR